MTCIKKNHSLLNDLDYEELAILNSNKYKVDYKAGEVICKTGTKPLGLICLYEGKVKITRTALNGNEQIVALKKPVDFIGFRTLMKGDTFLNCAIALEDCSVCILDKKDFFKVVSNNSDLAFKIIQFFTNELEDMERRMVNIAQKHIRARLADALLLIYDIYGISLADGILNVRLKRSELAALAYMTTANSIRVLSSFAKENLIEVNQRKIKINNMQALRQISDYGR